MKTTSLLAATAAGSAIALPLLATSGAAQVAPAQGTVQEFTRVVTDGGFIDAPPRRKQSPGDALVESSTLRNESAGAAGRAIDHCVVVDHRGTLTCTGVVLLHNGTLTFAGRTRMNGKPSAFAVTGGTGAYAGARGWIDDRPTGDDQAKSTLNLLAPR